jgi:hypothetical protein
MKRSTQISVVVVYFTMLHLSGTTLDKDQSNTALLLYKKGTEVTLEDNKYPMGMDTWWTSKSENLLKVSTVWLV